MPELLWPKFCFCFLLTHLAGISTWCSRCLSASQSQKRWPMAPSSRLPAGYHGHLGVMDRCNSSLPLLFLLFLYLQLFQINLFFFLSVPQQSELVGDSSSFLKSYSYMDFSPKFPDHNHNVMYEELLIFTSQLSWLQNEIFKLTYLNVLWWGALIMKYSTGLYSNHMY